MGWGVLGCGPNTTGLRVAGGMPAVFFTRVQQYLQPAFSLALPLAHSCSARCRAVKASVNPFFQASRTRLSESNGGSPRPSTRVVAQTGGPDFLARDCLAQARRKGTRLSESPSRLSESPSRLSETPWPERRAWARLGGEQRYPPQVQASTESDQVIRIWMSRVVS
ncbi:hypothetical protein DEO72_LG5g2506 [Vigna unguiculata]|uniref:Uncharacterized protein n=1 Tax=Vigna unguiculata TaxID=3917 RepID=A0A4D6LZX1_VIGUN|nr:hypothetical protein DEO72_LG5g2506 [Vigna unguiculata]